MDKIFEGSLFEIFHGIILELDKTSVAESEAKVVAEVRNMMALFGRDDLRDLREHLVSLNKLFRHRPPNDPVRRQFMHILEVACLEAKADTVYR